MYIQCNVKYTGYNSRNSQTTEFKILIQFYYYKFQPHLNLQWLSSYRKFKTNVYLMRGSSLGACMKNQENKSIS